LGSSAFFSCFVTKSEFSSFPSSPAASSLDSLSALFRSAS
jgi:hypothetical protein